MGLICRRGWDRNKREEWNIEDQSSRPESRAVGRRRSHLDRLVRRGGCGDYDPRFSLHPDLKKG